MRSAQTTDSLTSPKDCYPYSVRRNMIALVSICSLWTLAGVALAAKAQPHERLYYSWLTIFGLTHIVAPWIGYRFFNNLEIAIALNRTMAIPANVYFPIVRTAFCIALGSAVVCSILQRKSRKFQAFLITNEPNSSRRIITILAISGTAMLVESLTIGVPGIFKIFLWVGLMMKWAIPPLLYRSGQFVYARYSLVLLVFLDTSSGMFQQAFLIALTTVMLYDHHLLRPRRILALGLPLFALSFGLLTLKADYRRQQEKGVFDVVQFYNQALDTGIDFLTSNKPIQMELAFELNRRLNQGWLLSESIKHVHEHGHRSNHLRHAYSSALLPKFLFNEKIDAGGRFNITNFTDITINSRTSMNIGVFGDHFVTYGGLPLWVSWTAFCLLLFMTIGFATGQFLTHSEIGIFLPVVLFYCLKSETDVVSVFGHIIKISVILKIFTSLIPLQWKR